MVNKITIFNYQSSKTVWLNLSLIITFCLANHKYSLMSIHGSLYLLFGPWHSTMSCVLNKKSCSSLSRQQFNFFHPHNDKIFYASTPFVNCCSLLQITMNILQLQYIDALLIKFIVLLHFYLFFLILLVTSSSWLSSTPYIILLTTKW